MDSFQRPETSEHSDIESRNETEMVYACVKARLYACQYSFHFNKVTWRYADGTLSLRGTVGTFHLKQKLQTLLRDIEYVERLVNEVEVVSATGLSSGRESQTDETGDTASDS